MFFQEHSYVSRQPASFESCTHEDKLKAAMKWQRALMMESLGLDAELTVVDSRYEAKARQWVMQYGDLFRQVFNEDPSYYVRSVKDGADIGPAELIALQSLLDDRSKKQRKISRSSSLPSITS